MIFDDRNWLKAQDIKDGDILKILDKGDFVTSAKFTKANGEPKKDFVCKVEYNGNKYDLTINKSRRDDLISAFGKDSEGWVNKTCKVKQEDCKVGSKMLKTIKLFPIGGNNVQYEA